MDKSDIGNRFKAYEAVSCHYLPRRIPVLIRLDGRAFHTLTRKLFGRRYDRDFAETMATVAVAVQQDIQGCDFAYCQSDEITFFLTDYKTVHTDPWFDYNQSKMLSISASIASATMSRIYNRSLQFDARAFSVPHDDVINNFVWRQNDATRNAIQMAGREHFSHSELNGVNCNQIQEKLFSEKGINFNDYPVTRKRGFCTVNGKVDWEIPIFTQNRSYIKRFVDVRED